MKLSKKIIAMMLALMMLVSLAACGGGDDSDSSSQTDSSASQEDDGDESEEQTESEDTSEGDDGLDSGGVPREETLYVNIGQWGKVIDKNPFSSNSSNFALGQNDTAKVIIYETLYMYNILNGELYPLLADGEPMWNDDRTEITVKIKEAAKWSDGTALTAHDVAYTFDAHVRNNSIIGLDYSQYIESVTATDDYTVVFAVKMDNENQLKVLEYLPKVYVTQKAYGEEIEAQGDAEAFKTNTMFDAPYSGPYDLTDFNEEMVRLERNEEYWGQDASMWGSLPAPKYMVHNIFSGNNSADDAMIAGQIDVSQGYIANVENLWNNLDIPASTYLSEAPYHLAGTMPTLFFNTTREGLDQVAVRQAIAYAIDYNQILTNAMTNQSPTFSDVPRSLFNPSTVEQEIYDRIGDSLTDLQWESTDYDRANKVLDDAGILDTNNDGNREYNGEELMFRAECPTGWTDWNAALDLVAEAGANIGISIETYYPEAAVWTEDIQTGNFDMAMASPPGFSIANPWGRAYNLLYGFGGEFPERMNFAYSRLYDERVDELLSLIPTETDQDVIDGYLLELNEFYLEQVPSVALMYRPEYFHTVVENVWTGFPEADDGTDIPPGNCMFGYGVAALYEIRNIE